MDGRTHRFTAFITITAFTAILTYFNMKNHGEVYTQFWYIMAVIIVAGYFYLHASKWINKKNAYVKGQKEYEKDLKEDKQKTHEKEVKYEHKFRDWEIAAWLLLILVIVVVVYTSDLIDETKTNLTLSQALCLSKMFTMINLVLGAYAGSSTPDMDWDFNNHRNAVSHSYILPFFVWAYSMVVIPYELRYVMIIINMYCLGYATHLLLDTMPSDTVGAGNLLKMFFKFSQSPGNVIHIKPKRQHFWLFFSGVVLLAAFFFGIPRFYGTTRYSWNQFGTGAIPWNQPGIDIIAWVSIGLLVIWIIMYLSFREKPKDQEKSHKTKRPKNHSPLVEGTQLKPTELKKGSDENGA